VSFPPCVLSHVSQPFELVHPDVGGPSRESSFGFCYCPTFIDDCSCTTWLNIIKTVLKCSIIFVICWMLLVVYFSAPICLNHSRAMLSLMLFFTLIVLCGLFVLVLLGVTVLSILYLLGWTNYLFVLKNVYSSVTPVLKRAMSIIVILVVGTTNLLM